MSKGRERQVFQLIGGRPAIDFVNTVGGVRPEAPEEGLHDYRDLVDFAEQAGLIDRKLAARLAAEAERHPGRAADVLARARRYREALYRLLAAPGEGRSAADDELRTVDAWIAESLGARRLSAAPGGGFTFAWDDDDLAAPLQRLGGSAAELLTTGDVSRVHVCAESEARRCTWLFLDETRNHSRRFCTMEDCGNRAKQRRFQERKRRDR
jgi:predicted RNA-binding Zn ribbon-like protein